MRESPLVQDWLAEGEAKERTRIAVKLLRRGLDPTDIAEDTGLTLSQIQQLQHQIADE